MASPNEYVAVHITPTLTKGLRELARARPADPRTWLAEWLIANKPPLPKRSLAWAGGKLTTNKEEAVEKYLQRKQEDLTMADVVRLKGSLKRRGPAAVKTDTDAVAAGSQAEERPRRKKPKQQKTPSQKAAVAIWKEKLHSRKLRRILAKLQLRRLNKSRALLLAPWAHHTSALKFLTRGAARRAGILDYVRSRIYS